MTGEDVARVGEFFSQLLSEVEQWATTIAGALESGAAGQSLDVVVADAVRPALLSPERILTSAGFVSAPGAGRGEPWQVSWWTASGGELRTLQIRPQSDPISRQYTRLEWWRGPVSSGRSQFVGPYVDYPGSGDTALSAAAPVISAGQLRGVVAADMLLGRLERLIGGTLERIGARATIVNAQGRVLLSADPALAAGDMLARASGYVDRLVIPCEGAQLSIVL